MRCLAIVVGITIRIAQRMGLHSEATLDNLPALESELRRRLWWSLIAFDYRLCELTVYKATTLLPTWDCDVPSNINDFELRPDMKILPVSGHTQPSEAIFPMVRSAIADSVRHSEFHLNLVNPVLKVLVTAKETAVQLNLASTGPVETLLSKCNMEDRVHYMTYWTAKGLIARSRLLEYYTKRSTAHPDSNHAQQPEDAVSYALEMLDSNTKLRTSPLTKGYMWLVDLYLPALAYQYILNILRKAPGARYAERAWQAVDENYQASLKRPRQSHIVGLAGGDVYMIKFGPVIVRAWEAHEEFCAKQQKSPGTPPMVVTDVMRRLRESHSNFGSVTLSEVGECVASANAGGNLSSDQDTMADAQSISGEAEGVMDYLDYMSAEGGSCWQGNDQVDADMDQFWMAFDWRWINAQR